MNEFLKTDPEQRREIEEQRNQEEIDYENMSVDEQAAHLAKLQEWAELHHGQPLSERKETENDAEFQKQLELANDIAVSVEALGGKALVVGGYVRDEVLRRMGEDIKPKDIDLEIYGLDFEKIKELLERFGRVDVVGAQFGVLKVGGLDVSLPRQDSKVEKGHRGIAVTGDPHMSVSEAARRRDFTINALCLDPITGQVLDYYGGVEDLRLGVLRATDHNLFKDDPLRAMRAVQLGSRYQFEIDPATLEICRQMPIEEVSKERIGEEWRKMLLKSEQPSLGLELARQTGIIKKLHPELDAIIDLKQDQVWHPEGDVWMHTLLVTDEAAKLARQNQLAEEDYLVLTLSALTHDFGKAATTTTRADARIISHGHCEAGVDPARKFLKEIDTPKKLVSRILPLIKDHLFPTVNQEASASAVRRLADRLYPATIQELVWLAQADHSGRKIPADGFPQGRILMDKAEALEVKLGKPAPLLRGYGQELIGAGMKPGRKFGDVLRRVYDLQLSGEITTIESARQKALEFWHESEQ